MMAEAEATKWLRIPLYKLYYIDDLDGFKGLSESELSAMDREYSPEERANIVEALRWAAQHPDFEFNQLLPELRWSNPAIHRYLSVLHQQLRPAKI